MRTAPYIIYFLLQNYAYQTVTAVVDYLLYGLPYLKASLLGHTVELIVQALVDKVADRFAEDIAVPYLSGALFKLLQKVGHELLALLL